MSLISLRHPLLIGALALALAACGGKGAQDEAAPGPTAVPEGTVAVASDDEAGADDEPVDGADEVEASLGATGDEACADYATKLCEMVGEEGETCASVQAVVGGLLPPAACEAGAEDLAYTEEALAAMKASCTELVDKLCGDLGEATETCAMVRRETPNFPPERCAAFLEQYDMVLADLKRMEAQNKPLSAEEQAALTAGEHVMTHGPEDAAVTLVEFSDFQCPYCVRAAEATSKIKEIYGDKVRIVFRQYPLPFHEDAHLAGQASLAAGAQGKFWAYHDMLFDNQKALKRADLERYAGALELDMDAFKGALDDETYAAQVDADLALGQKVGVQGTPTMFINGNRVQNPTQFEAIEPMLDATLAE